MKDIHLYVVYPAMIFFGIAFPLIRGYLRHKRRITPVFTRINIKSDLEGGLTFPLFIWLALSPFFLSKEFAEIQVTFAILGLSGVYMVVNSLVDHKRNPNSRERSGDQS